MIPGAAPQPRGDTNTTGEGRQMTETSWTDDDPMTFVTVWEPEAGREQELFEILRSQTETWMTKLPGFRSTRLYLEDDGKHIVSATEWDNSAAHAAAQANPSFGPLLAEAIAFSKRTSMRCHSFRVIA